VTLSRGILNFKLIVLKVGLPRWTIYMYKCILIGLVRETGNYIYFWWIVNKLIIFLKEAFLRLNRFAWFLCSTAVWSFALRFARDIHNILRCCHFICCFVTRLLWNAIDICSESFNNPDLLNLEKLNLRILCMFLI